MTLLVEKILELVNVKEMSLVSMKQEIFLDGDPVGLDEVGAFDGTLVGCDEIFDLLDERILELRMRGMK